jgi:hypothetical protein
MKRTTLSWVIAFLLTIALAVFQRVTGPTYPMHGVQHFEGKDVAYRFERSHSGESDHTVVLPPVGDSVRTWLEWKRFKAPDEWSRVPMNAAGDRLIAELPWQPRAGKLEYRIILEGRREQLVLPAGSPAVIRFRGDVPPSVLYPHILLMFAAMLLSTRTGLEFFSPSRNLKNFELWTIGLLFVGGLVLGPLVQHYAFGEYWTGWPIGNDLTDNKTAVALIAWIVAAVALSRSKKPARWAFGAAVTLLVVFLIPHSVLGSEIDYSKSDRKNPPSRVSPAP